MGLLERIEASWNVIAAAPFMVVGLMFGAAALGFGASQFLARRESNAARAERDAAKAETTLLEQRIKILAVPPTREAFLEITSPPGNVVKFYGAPSEWAKVQPAKFAAFTALQEAGLAKIVESAPNTTVTSTSSASDLRALIDRPKG